MYMTFKSTLNMTLNDIKGDNSTNTVITTSY